MGYGNVATIKINISLCAQQKTIYNSGIELDGNQYAVSNNLMSIDNSFFQRGEIRPKFGLETNLTKNMRFIANAGVRINGRFNIADNYDGKLLLVENAPKTNAFVNIGIGWISLKLRKNNFSRRCWCFYLKSLIPAFIH